MEPKENAGLRNLEESMLDMIAGGAMDADDEEAMLEIIQMGKDLGYTLDDVYGIMDGLYWEDPEERAEYYEFVKNNW